ncbi:ankyrin [Parathielavia hyrcaniae]|uniref:Ankyrin n=1 Tax=Parathielavia hyrcaniae TaxID=113614 RepID=A0AAN6Q9A3_9PEZI|nr:ankyrin [Parathielavia hyrcaniae]
MAAAGPLPTLPVPLAGLVKHIAQHPKTPMMELLEPYRQYEAHLRQAFAQDPGHELLKDPHVNVLPLFTEDTQDIKIRARKLESESAEEKSKHIMPLPAEIRRPDGSPAIVQSLKEFQRNFSVFSESSLTEINWDNVVAAGSSVVNTLLPVPDEYNRSKRGLRQFYHEIFSPASDVDLFLYGLTEEQAIEKIKEIETRVRDALLSEITVVRTKHAVTICSQYPTRHIQIVLRIYKSVSEILTGFDIDCSGAAFDGKQVYCTPRALQSYLTQINHIDLSRRSPSYENRLSKYSRRGFEVYWPDLDRSRVDPTIFERSFQRTLGLARLLVLERLPTSRARDAYLDERREERGRPEIDRYRRRLQALAGNIKEDYEDEVADWFNEDEVSNYNTFTVPYGPRFHAKRIEKLCYTRDLLLNAEWNQPDDREVYLHRHPAFFGRFEDVANDCCGYCPVPRTDEEKEVAEEEEKVYVSGKISFMKDDPGRQAIHLAAMSSTPDIVRALVDAGARLIARVADGRTALHLAAARGDVEIVKILLDKSAANEAESEEKQDQRRREKNATKTDDGKTEAEEADGSEESDGELIDEPESDDEAQSMATGSFVKVTKKEAEALDEAALDDTKEEPDFYDINVVAWDKPCSALHFAIVEGHVEVVKTLEYGADVLLPVKFTNLNGALLTLVLALALPVEKAKEMAMTLLALGATSAQADMNGITAFHRYVEANAETLLQSLWETDPAGAKIAINHIAFPSGSSCETPLQFAVKEGNLALILELLNHGAVAHIDFETCPHENSATRRFCLKPQTRSSTNEVVTRLKSAKQSANMENQLRTFEDNQKRYEQMVEQPLILALESSHPETAIQLLERGVDPNVVTSGSRYHMRSSWPGQFMGSTALDVADYQLKVLFAYDEEPDTTSPPSQPQEMNLYLKKFKEGTYEHWVVSEEIEWLQKSYRRDLNMYEKNKNTPNCASGVKEKNAAIANAIQTMRKVKDALLAKGAKPFAELFPEFKDRLEPHRISPRYNTRSGQAKTWPSKYNFSFQNVNDVTETRKQAYLQLFNAAWTGDLETIKKLTLTSWDDAKEEAPLKIAVHEHGNNPFSLAFSRGHFHVAKAVLEIAQAQYAPEEKPKARYRMQAADEESEYSDDDSDCSDDGSVQSDSGPRIYREILGGQYTIDNVGQVSMKVNSRTRPLEMITWTNPLLRVIFKNDMQGLKFLLEVGERWGTQKLEPDDEVSGFSAFPDHAFKHAVELGRVEMLGEIIKRTGAGLPLEHLVKDSGVELKEKPRYYQGLTVYGKKRNDWANAGRDVARRPSGTETSPLLLGAFAGRIESVEWFLSDTPLRHYLAFAKSKAAREDVRLKHLARASGGIDAAISKWLDDQSDLLLHAAIYAPPSSRATELVAYLVRTQPSLVHVRAANGATPLLLAYQLGRLDAAKILVDVGAEQTTKDQGRNNLLHAALQGTSDVKKLKPMLDLLDRGALVSMLKERNKLSQAGGRTPLHQYCSAVAKSGYHNAAAKPAIRMIKMLISISPETAKQALSMLDGTGDTPLHTLLAKDADPAIVRTLVDFDPSLLCCENAVGRTPAEVAHDRYLGDKIQCPEYGRYRYDESVSSLVNTPASQFVLKSKKPDSEAREHEAKTVVAKNWRLCADIMARNGQPKRTLVSLHSANLVAQRLGERHMKARYRFELVKQQQQDGGAPTGSQDDGGSEAGEVESADADADADATAPAEKTKRRQMDEISMFSGSKHAWARPKEDGEDNDDGLVSSGDEEETD